MSKNNHTKQSKRNKRNKTAIQTDATSPAWYPDLPEQLVSQACLPILWSIMTGQSLTERDGDLTNAFIERLRDLVASRSKPTPELILEMANAIHPGASHEIIRAFLRGITETVIISQSIPLPSIPNFLEDHPHIMPLEEKLKGLAAAKDALDSIRATVGILKNQLSSESGS